MNPDDEHGRRLLERHVATAQAFSDAIGRGRVLVPGQRPIAEVWNEYYDQEWRRLRQEAQEAEDAFMMWLRRPRGGE